MPCSKVVVGRKIDCVPSGEEMPPAARLILYPSIDPPPIMENMVAIGKEYVGTVFCQFSACCNPLYSRLIELYNNKTPGIIGFNKT